MDRLEFLEKARQLACEQVENSSALSDDEFANLLKMGEEKALYKKAKRILDDAFHDIAVL